MSLIKKELISSSKYSIKCPYSMNPIGLCIHNTYNDAPAKNEASYMKNNNNQVSFHVVVDDKEAIQVIEFNRNAWAAGDGNGSGNRKYIHMEICYSKSGGDRFAKAERLAVKVAAEILKKYNWNVNNIKAHRDFSGKNCPHRTNMTNFKELVRKEMSGSSSSNTSSTTIKDGDYSGRKARVVRVASNDVLNVRYDRDPNAKDIGDLKPGAIVTCEFCLKGWMSIRGYKGNKGLGYVNAHYLELL